MNKSIVFKFHRSCYNDLYTIKFHFLYPVVEYLKYLKQFLPWTLPHWKSTMYISFNRIYILPEDTVPELMKL